MAPWIRIVLIFSGWAALHTLLASLMMKKAAARLFGIGIQRWYRILYILVALATGIPWVLILTGEGAVPLYALPQPWKWVFHSIQAAGGIALFRSIQVSNPRSFLGFSQIKEPEPRFTPVLKTDGLYRITRHPMYLATLLLIWFTPGMTDSLLSLYICITAYFFLGSIHEEKLLIHEFGDHYREYRKKTGRIIPFFP